MSTPPPPAALKPTRPRALSEFERRFLEELAVDGRQSVAARRAGSKAKNPCEIGRQILERPHVAAEWARMKAERAAAQSEDRERILNELRYEAFADAGDLFESRAVRLRAIDELPPEMRRAIVSVKVKHYPGRTDDDEPYEVIEVKLADKLRATELLMRHHQMLIDRHEVTGAGGGPIVTAAVTLTEEERLARVRDLVATAVVRRNGDGA